MLKQSVVRLPFFKLDIFLVTDCLVTGFAPSPYRKPLLGSV